MLWASASVAAKYGLQSAEPLVLFQVRFLIAGLVMLGYAYIFNKSKMPSRQELKHLSVFGFLNVTLYLSLFVLGIKEVAAGIGSLAIALNPLMMSVLSALLLGRKIKNLEIIGLVLGILGVVLAVYPLFASSYVNLKGLIYLGLSMLSYSYAAIYYTKVEIQIDRMAINGWQVLLGGIFMIPMTYLLHHQTNHFDSMFWWSVLWMAFPVSTTAVGIWLWLLNKDAVKASFFLFLCPIFGFIYASILLNEPFTIYTMLGLILVLGGLFLGQWSKLNKL